MTFTERSPAVFEVPEVPDLSDAALTQRLQHILDNKTKPVGALGQLEALALRIGTILGSEVPALACLLYTSPSPRDS